MKATVVFDDGCAELAPLTDLRASFDVRTGAWTTLERVAARLGGVSAVVTPRTLEGLTRDRHGAGVAVNELGRLGGEVAVLNGRAPLAWRLVHGAAGLGRGQGVIDEASGALVAAVVAAERVGGVLAGDRSGLEVVKRGDAAARVMSRPWHVRSQRDACLVEDLEWLAGRRGGRAGHQLGAGAVAMGTGAVWVAESASVGPMTVFDAGAGPIVVAEHAVVRPGAMLIGPCFVGAHATVLERATIRAQTSIGPWCKVNGEVGGTIFQGYSNKAHDGYLGDSYVGEWVNLGAGTTNSNLLNTYGEVLARATPGGRTERTGEQFLGAVLGDHVKTAICTRLMTGCVVHTGAMLATTAAVSGCVGAMAWCTDEGVRSYRLDKFLEVMGAAMGRRKVTPGAAYVARVRELHASAAKGSA